MISGMGFFRRRAFVLRLEEALTTRRRLTVGLVRLVRGEWRFLAVALRRRFVFNAAFCRGVPKNLICFAERFRRRFAMFFLTFPRHWAGLAILTSWVT